MFELCEATFQTIAQAFASGELTSLELTLRYLERIADIDREGPALNAVLEINPDAVDIAEALDREYAQKGPRGPLHGVPVLIKDNINTRSSPLKIQIRIRHQGGSISNNIHLRSHVSRHGIGLGNLTQQ